MGNSTHSSDAPSDIKFDDLKTLPPHDVRQKIREGTYNGQTAGLCLGYLQGNIAIVPADYAKDFLQFCRNNPKPCPLVGMSAPGSPSLPSLGKDIDIRTDVPAYHVYREGQLEARVASLSEIWQDDMTTFVLGCSFSFEEALIADGISLRHIDTGKTVAMYRTSFETIPAGPFVGPIVVSMRPLSPDNIDRAREITARFPQAHGSPIHAGDPAAIGIEDINTPDWGDQTEIKPGETPVFWACGVTPQAAIQAARLPLFISHAPGHMLITDIKSDDPACLRAVTDE